MHDSNSEIPATRVIFPRARVADLAQQSVSTTNLGPTEVVLKTTLTLISPGTELAAFQAKPWIASDQPRKFPFDQLGYAAVGTVLAAGERAGVAVGERVYAMSPHASVARIDAELELCLPVPETVSDEEAVFARLATVSMTTLRSTLARGGDDVAVVGLGLVGNLAAQVFGACGMMVHGFELNPARRRIAEQCGIESVHAPEDMALFARRHPLVIEATGSAAALASALSLAAFGGEVVMIGVPWGGAENSVSSNKLTTDLFWRYLRLRSGFEWELPRVEAESGNPRAGNNKPPQPFGSIQRNARVALQWLADGRLNVQPLVTHRLPAERAQEAYDGLLHNPNDYMGVLLQWTALGPADGVAAAPALRTAVGPHD